MLDVLLKLPLYHILKLHLNEVLMLQKLLLLLTTCVYYSTTTQFLTFPCSMQ